MKVSKLAQQIGMQPAQLYRELVHRGLQIPSVEHPIDTTNAEAILAAAAKPGPINFDALFGPVRTYITEAAVPKEAGIPYNRRDNALPDSKEFELAVGRRLHAHIPNSHLSNVFLFIADQLATNDPFGREIDHLVHVRERDSHRLLIIECKNQKIIPDENARPTVPLQHRDWYALYTDSDRGLRKKPVKEQMWAQARAVLQTVKPLPDMHLRIEAIAVSSDEQTEDLVDDRGQQDPRVFYRTMNWGSFQTFLADLERKHWVLRVSQSELLRRIRQGM